MAENYHQVVNDLREQFDSGKTLSLEFRRQQLSRFRDMLTENEEPIHDALYKDLKKSKAEANCTETLILVNEVNTALAELKNWAKPTKVSRNLLQLTDSAYLHKEPLGVVLIMGAWNYPIQLSLSPMVGAIAAGCCIILKPSEVSKNCEQLLADMLPKYLDPDVYKVVKGGVSETTELLKERFDHIFYTGSSNVGKIVMQAAALNLTPVTLELGGKCPAIVDSNANMSVVARRVAWGKFTNCGQTCVTVDYVLCTEDRKDKFLEELRKTLHEFYGDTVKDSPDYSRIVNERHFDRIKSLLDKTRGNVVIGGINDRQDLYIEPTVVDNVTAEDSLMSEEIFGPILPIVTVADMDEAIQFVKKREKPLTLYLFSADQAVIDKVLNQTSSGSVTVNDTMMHMTLETLPFGGVGHSGMGRYHGKYSFDTFSHEKSVLHRPTGAEQMIWMRYPPFDEKKMSWARFAVTKRRIPFL